MSLFFRSNKNFGEASDKNAVCHQIDFLILIGNKIVFLALSQIFGFSDVCRFYLHNILQVIEKKITLDILMIEKH